MTPISEGQKNLDIKSLYTQANTLLSISLPGKNDIILSLPLVPLPLFLLLVLTFPRLARGENVNSLAAASVYRALIRLRGASSADTCYISLNKFLYSLFNFIILSTSSISFYSCLFIFFL